MLDEIFDRYCRGYGLFGRMPISTSWGFAGGLTAAINMTELRFHNALTRRYVAAELSDCEERPTERSLNNRH